MKKLTYIILLICAFQTINAQDYTLNGNLIVGSDSTNTLEVTGDSRVQGDAEVEGELKLSMMMSSTTDYPKILYADENGRVQSMSTDQIDSLLLAVYKMDCKGVIGMEEPVWQNEPNILYVKDPCVPFPRVGIDTDSPQATFHVKGSSIFSNIDQVDLTTFSQQQMLIYKDGGNSSQYGLRMVSDSSDFNSLAITNIDSGDDMFRVLGNGNLYATQITVLEFENFPDYVFEEGYVLMPLLDLEKYIEENGHLPNMPSSAEVKENGANMSELMRLHTEKIEELTLHTIEQQKRLNEMSETLEKLNAELERLKKN